jgi:hypothetical protein
VFEGYAVVPAEATPDAVGAWWRCKNSGGSDYDAYRALIAVASGDKRPEDLWKPETILGIMTMQTSRVGALPKHWLEYDIPDCPYCGRRPDLRSCQQGDVIECDKDDCQKPETDRVLPYTTMGQAAVNWIDYVLRAHAGAPHLKPKSI